MTQTADELKTVDQVYFLWLASRVAFNYGKNNGKTYVDLAGQLHTKEFVWVVANDDNRLEDALALRHLFISESGITKYGNFLNNDPPLSVLEVIVGLSQRCAFTDGGNPRQWAWKLIENLDLSKLVDPMSAEEQEVVDDILETLIYRNYAMDGSGGFFPLRHPKENQKEVEIWYQMNAYIEELMEN